MQQEPSQYKKLKFMTWYINGISTWKEEIPRVLKIHEPDIVLLQESRLDKASMEAKHISFPGYSLYHKERDENSGGGLKFGVDLGIYGAHTLRFL